MTFVHIAMIGAGVAAVVWGLPAMHRLRRPLDVVAALAVLAGVAAALMGTLLTVVPDFFKG